MKLFRIKNFEKFQSQRRGKNVPWIKLMVNWREDYEVASLTDGQAMQYVGMLCLASRQGPELRWDPTWIKRKIGCNASVNLELFENKGLIEEVVYQPVFRCLPNLAEGKGSDRTKREREPKPKTKTKKRERKKTSLDHYHKLFFEKFGSKPMILEKHGPMMARLEKKMGRPEIIDLLDRYFKTDDQFIINAGFTIDLFGSQINKLIASRAGNGAGPVRNEFES